MGLDANIAKKFINARILEAMTELQVEVIGEMKSKAPVKTGFIDNIHGETEVSGDNVVSEFHSDAPYSVFVDKGTSKMNAQPFFDSSLIGYERRLKEKT